MQKKLEESQTALNQLNQKSENLLTAKQNYENLDFEVKNKVNNYLPAKVELKSLIQTLELAASENNASISAIQLQPLTLEQPSQTMKTLIEIPFTFNIEGTYQSLLNFPDTNLAQVAKQ